MATVQNKKVITLSNTKSAFSMLVLSAKHVHCKNWEAWQEDICKNMGSRQEIRLLERVAKVFGMNPIEYDDEPLHVFIDNIWREAKNYTITIDTTLE